MNLSKQECLDHNEKCKASGLSRNEYARNQGWDDIQCRRWIARVGNFLYQERQSKPLKFTPVKISSEKAPEPSLIDIVMHRDGKLIQVSGLRLDQVARLFEV